MKNYQPNLLPNLTSFNIGQLGNNPDAINRRSYELRSRGPAVLGVDALDNLLRQHCLLCTTVPPC